MKYGWTTDEIDEMDFDQIADAWREGKKQKGIRVGSDADVFEIARNWRRYYHGL